MRVKDRTPYKYNAQGSIVPNEQPDGWIIEHMFKDKTHTVTFSEREAKKADSFLNVRVRPFRFTGPASKKPYR